MSDLQTLRAQVVAKRENCRTTATVNLRTGEYKNPIRQGYDRAMTEVLELVDQLTADFGLLAAKEDG
ncbi:hypothetical protein AB0E01_23190 [Nocardia vinacea]|uniref:hypothetical protein n=1 Tax=Nocardia vinacea TaxID=96468 RepID=UPI0033FE63A3